MPPAQDAIAGVAEPTAGGDGAQGAVADGAEPKAGGEGEAMADAEGGGPKRARIVNLAPCTLLRAHGSTPGGSRESNVEPQGVLCVSRQSVPAGQCM